jgi:sulfite reductase alpha subunit
VSAASLGDGNTLCIDNKNCVRCMHCLNVIPGGLLPGSDKGVSILVGGKGVLKIGATMGTVVIPFMKLESDEDFEKLNELARNILDFFAENALEHERTGEMIERIGLTNFLEGLDIPVDPNMIKEPRSNPYFRADDWDEQVEKWNEHKQSAASFFAHPGIRREPGPVYKSVGDKTWQNYVRLSSPAHRIRCPTCTP